MSVKMIKLIYGESLSPYLVLKFCLKGSKWSKNLLVIVAKCQCTIHDIIHDHHYKIVG